jgi:outer membrane protein OmpA-like peptidoglycan-associated protein
MLHNRTKLFALTLGIMALALTGCRSKRRVVTYTDDTPMYIDVPEHETVERQVALFDDGVDAFIFAEDTATAAAPVSQESMLLAHEEQPATLDFVWEDMEPALHKMHKVQFEYDRARLTQAELDHLKSDICPWAQEMVKAGRKICIKGHACLWHGTSAYNLALSNSRAYEVKKMLEQEFGVPADSIQAFGVGNEEPIAFGNSPEEQSPNRRAEIYAVAA